MPTEVLEIVDRGAWNAIVASFRQHDFHQGFEWGETRASQGWRPRRLALYQDGHCEAAVSVLFKRLPLLRWSAACAPGGPLLKDPTASPVWETLLSAMLELVHSEHAVFLRSVSTLPRDQDLVAASLERHGFVALPDDWTTWNAPRVIMRMTVTGSEEALRRALRRRFREYVATAEHRGLRVRSAVSIEEGLRFREALATVGQRRGQPVRSHVYFERLWREYVRSGKGVLLLAEHDGRTVGGLLGVCFGERAHMLHVVAREPSGSPRLHQAPVLYWEFVRWAKRAGCTAVDWGGVGTHFPPREDDPGYGLYHFKLGLNAGIEHLAPYYDLILSPLRYKLFRFIERRIAEPAWRLRGRLNRKFDRVGEMREAVLRKGRQFAVSMRQRGLAQTFYWGAFGFLRPNRFLVFGRSLRQDCAPPSSGGDLTAEVWDAAAVRDYRSSRSGLPPEFYQDEVDGVEYASVVRLAGEVAGLIWMYRTEDASRLFRLRDMEAEVNNGVVVEACRGRGAFKVALATACDWLREEGCETVYAMVHSGNQPSRRAFEAVGFRRLATVRHFLFYRPTYRVPGKFGADLGRARLGGTR